MSVDPPNPYEPPNFTDQPLGYGKGVPSGINPSILVQQRVISILMIVHGSLMLVTGLALLCAAVLMPTMVIAEMKKNGQPQLESMELILLCTYGGMALSALLPGILQIYAGIRNLWLRGHMLGMIALGSGLLGIASCYCFPSAIALSIYGIIIYLNESTKQAFQLAREGNSYDDIMRQAYQGK